MIENLNLINLVQEFENIDIELETLKSEFTSILTEHGVDCSEKTTFTDLANGILEIKEEEINKSIKAINLKTARSDTQATECKNLIYYIGGYSTSNLSSVEVYNPKTNTISAGISAPTTLRGGGACNKPDSPEIHVVAYSSHYVFNVDTQVWTQKPSCIISFQTAGVGECLGDMYTAGGYNSRSHIYKYEFKTETWTLLSSNAPTSLHNFSSYGYNSNGGKIHAISQQGWYCYDVKTNTWETMKTFSNLNTDRGGCCFGDLFYTFEGYGGSYNAYINYIYCYNPLTKTETRKSNSNYSRIRPAVSVYKNCAYIGGGWCYNSVNSHSCYIK